MHAENQRGVGRVRLWDVLLSVGFTPVEGRLAPCLRFDFGSFAVEALETTNRHFADVVLLTGYAFGQRVMAELIQELPREVESRQQGIAWIAWAIETSLGDFLGPQQGVAPSWLEEARTHRRLLPWERDREAYERRRIVPCRGIGRDWRFAL